MIYKHQHLSIESPFQIQAVDTLALKAEVNHHTHLTFEGIISSDTGFEALQRQIDKAQVKISLAEDDYCLFCGYPVEIAVSQRAGLYLLKMTCISFTYFLDVEQHSRSFQNCDQLYTDMLRDAYEKSDNADVLFSTAAEKRISAPIFQYDDTDWQFTLRMAGKLKTIVIANDKSPVSQVFIGVPSRSEKQLDAVEYTSGRNYRDEALFRVKAKPQLELGDKVQFKGHPLIVVAKNVEYSQGVFNSVYTLSTLKGYAVRPFDDKLAGLTLRGTVLETRGEKMRLHLDIDASQSVDDAYWFEFEPEVGNVMYCMPQKGTHAFLKFSEKNGGSAAAIHCIRENGESCAEMADFNKRYFTTEFKKKLAMLPSALFFEADSNKMECADASGININTGKQITLNASDSIQINAQKKIFINTPEHIYMTKPGSKSVIDFAGGEINIDSVKVNFRTDPTPNPPGYPPVQIEPPVAMSRGLASMVAGSVPRMSRI